MTIKLAQQSDVDYIMEWLEAEYRANGVGFFCNASVIQSYFRNELLYVFLDESQFAVGFITGPTTGPDILAVREDRQKQGIGSQLAEFMINKARDENICVMHIQCEPETSVPFWRKMGFETILPETTRRTTTSSHALPPE